MKTFKIFFFETRRHRALVIGKYHHLLDLYQVCSNYTAGAKNDPVGKCFTYAYKGKMWEKETSRLKPQGLKP